MINYFVWMDAPESHYFKVGMEISPLADDVKYFDLKLPVWRSGRYLVLDFASGLQEFNAYDGSDKVLRWEKINKYTWRIYHGSSDKIKVNYKMYANEFEMRTKGLNSEHAFINSSSLFMFNDLKRYDPLTLTVYPYDNWHVTTGLEKTGDNIFSAPSYDYFIDCPLEIGNQAEYEFEAGEKKHIICFSGKAEYEINKLINDFTTIINKNIQFWGRLPYEKYLFIIHCTPTGSGGTEHINSTVVGIKPKAFETLINYKAFLRLISHEFFHTWNVKQLKPAGLTPYNYTGENYTSELWIAEGGTSYYDGLILTRCGLMSENDFFEELTKAVYDERQRPGYRVQSVAESSFDAWIKFWRRSPNAYFSESDYYVMGSYVCMILDLEIMHASGAKYSLEDVFKAMFERFELDKKGYTNADFMKTCEEFAGIELNDIFNNHVYGTKEIDWEKYFTYAGLILNKTENPAYPAAGLFPGKSGDKIIVSRVIPGSAADRAGIIKGDEIIACNRERCSFETIEKKINSMKAGDSVKFTVFRSNSIMQFNVKLEEFSADSYFIEKVKNPSGLQRAIYEKWLGVNW